MRTTLKWECRYQDSFGPCPRYTDTTCKPHPNSFPCHPVRHPGCVGRHIPCCVDYMPFYHELVRSFCAHTRLGPERPEYQASVLMSSIPLS